MGKQWKEWETLFSWAPKSLQMVTVAMKLKDTYSLEGKLWPTSVHFSPVTQSCPALCDPMDCSIPSFSDHGILQARILKWVAMPFSRGLPGPKNEPMSPGLQADSLLFDLLGNQPQTCCWCSVTQLCLTLYDPWTAALQASLSFTIS